MWLPADSHGRVLGDGGSSSRHYFPHPHLRSSLVQYHQHNGRSTGVRLGK